MAGGWKLQAVAPKYRWKPQGVAVVPLITLGPGATERSFSGGTAGARMGAGGVVTVVLVMLGTGSTQESCSGGSAGARTGAGGVITVVPVILGTRSTKGSCSGDSAGARIGVETSGSAIVTAGWASVGSWAERD